VAAKFDFMEEECAQVPGFGKLVSEFFSRSHPPMPLMVAGGLEEVRFADVMAGFFWRTTAWKKSRMVSSEAPPRRRAPRSCSAALKRQARILPSAVNGAGCSGRKRVQ